jgi:hypothetical protein
MAYSRPADMERMAELSRISVHPALRQSETATHIFGCDTNAAWRDSYLDSLRASGSYILNRPEMTFMTGDRWRSDPSYSMPSDNREASFALLVDA